MERNILVLAFPLSIAFALASGVKPAQRGFTAMIGGGIIAGVERFAGVDRRADGRIRRGLI